MRMTRVGMLAPNELVFQSSWLNLGRILVQHGYQVDYLAIHANGLPHVEQLSDSIAIHRLVLFSRRLHGTRFQRLVRAIGVEYTFRCLTYCVTHPYDLYIGHNRLGFLVAYWASRLGGRKPLVYFQHDFESLDDVNDFLKRFEVRHAREADLVVSKEENRAHLFQREAQLSDRPLVILNCPFKPAIPGSNLLADRLKAKGLSPRHIVLHQ